MVDITRNESVWLSKKGVWFGSDGITIVNKTHSNKKHYMLCESPRNMRLLKEYRKNTTR